MMRPFPGTAETTLRTLAAALALAVCATAAGAQHEEDADTTRWRRAPRPKAPVIVQRACPFECCRYGRWTIVEPTVARERPRSNSRVVARLPFGAKVFADSGFVRIDTIGLVVLRESYVDGPGGVRFAAGDSLLVLDYVGEMVFNAWLRGRAVQTTTFWEEAPSVGRMVRDVSGAWWVRVRTGRGRRGWVDMSTTDVDGADACSM